MDEHAKIPRALIDKLFELGVMGIEIPESLRRRRRPASSTRSWRSRSCRASIRRSACSSTCRTRSSINALLRWGNDDIKRRYLPRLAPDTVGAYALSEAGSGSDAFALTTRAREDGDGYVLTGRKLWITNGNEADLFIVFATVNPEAGYRGITAFLVERGFAGFTVGKKEDKLGIRASSTCELIFEDCRVPRRTCSARSARATRSAIETLNEGRIGIGAQMIGLAAGALEHAIALHEGAQAVRQSRSPSSRPCSTSSRAPRSTSKPRGCTVYNAARLRDAGRPFLTEAAICKIFVVGSRRARRVARGQSVRRQRLRQGLPGREAVPRREDRPDLRGHVEPAAADDREADPRVTRQLVNW